MISDPRNSGKQFLQKEVPTIGISQRSICLLLVTFFERPRPFLVESLRKENSNDNGNRRFPGQPGSR